MAFIIIDLEFNNLNGINKYYPDIFNKNPDLKDIQIENEIIEIGAIKLDKYMKPLGEYKAYIKPSIIPVLNPKVLEITKISKEDLEAGISFEEGMDGLRNLIDEDDIICSWAKDDITEIISNAVYHKYNNLEWLKNYLDIQEYSTKILAHKKSLSLKNALEELKIRIDPEKLHDALNDAVYTSYVLKRIYNSRIIKSYVIKDVYNMPALEVKNLQEYPLDEAKVLELCPKCKVNVAIEYPLRPISWRFLSIGICPKCNSKVINEVVVKKTFTGEEVYKEVSTIVNEVEYINYTYKMNK